MLRGRPEQSADEPRRSSCSSGSCSSSCLSSRSPAVTAQTWRPTSRRERRRRGCGVLQRGRGALGRHRAPLPAPQRPVHGNDREVSDQQLQQVELLARVLLTSNLLIAIPGGLRHKFLSARAITPSNRRTRNPSIDHQVPLAPIGTLHLVVTPLRSCRPPALMLECDRAPRPRDRAAGPSHGSRRSSLGRRSTVAAASHHRWSVPGGGDHRRFDEQR
jgi:hypothetical protein